MPTLSQNVIILCAAQTSNATNDLKIKSSIFNNINIKIKLMNSVATIHNIIVHAQLYAFTLIFHNCLDSWQWGFDSMRKKWNISWLLVKNNAWKTKFTKESPVHLTGFWQSSQGKVWPLHLTAVAQWVHNAHEMNPDGGETQDSDQCGLSINLRF